MVRDKSSQAFVSSQEVEEEAGPLGNLPGLLPSDGPSPICLPTNADIETLG